MTNTKKLLGAAAFSLVLAGGGMAGALLGSPVTSGAQEATETAPTDETAESAHRHGRHGRHLEAAAEALGITADELKTALRDGQTIAEVAEANGVAVDTVIDAMVAAATADIRERITAVVNGEARPHRAHRGHHRGDDTDADTEAAPTSSEA